MSSSTAPVTTRYFARASMVGVHQLLLLVGLQYGTLTTRNEKKRCSSVGNACGCGQDQTCSRCHGAVADRLVESDELRRRRCCGDRPVIRRCSQLHGGDAQDSDTYTKETGVVILLLSMPPKESSPFASPSREVVGARKTPRISSGMIPCLNA